MEHWSSSVIFVIEGCDFMNRAILIVDDAEMNRDILRMFFEEQYTIYEAADEEEEHFGGNSSEKSVDPINTDNHIWAQVQQVQQFV